MQKRIQQRLAVVRRASFLAVAVGAMFAGSAAHAGLDLPSEAPAKAASVEAVTHVLELPKAAKGICIAGVCLGQTIDQLPKESAAFSGARGPGQWVVVTGSAKPVAVLQGINQVCRVGDLPSGVLRQVQLAFAPADASPGGVFVRAEPIPRQDGADGSAYTVTKIVMSVKSGNAEDGRNWPARVESRWPFLKPVLLENQEGGMVVDFWSMRPPVVKLAKSDAFGAKQDKIAHEVRYSVNPAVSFDDPEIGAKAWDQQRVTHTLSWQIGWDDATAWDLLSKQAGCAKPAVAATETEKAEVVAPVVKVKKVAPVHAVNAEPAKKAEPVKPAASQSEAVK